MNAQQAFQRALAASQKYTEETVIGLGALKGAPCTIKQIEEVKDTEGNVIANKITFEWTGTDGTNKTDTITVKNGTGSEIEPFEFVQTTPNEVWTIQHGLNKHYPNIICLDEQGNTLDGQINYLSENKTIIEFCKPVSGKAILE